MKNRMTYLEVDKKEFLSNINKIKNKCNKEIMPVIKANGYGTHINKQLDIINNFNIVAVAIADEAVELRNIGYKKEILILNQPHINDLEDIIKYDITFGLSSKHFLKYLSRSNEKIKVHLEIETGMNRTGININELEEFINEINLNKNILVEGIYTHFSSADSDIDYTNKQFEIFKKAIEITKNKIDTIKYVHTSASNGILNLKENITNLIRPGIIMYGFESFPGSNKIIDFKPICNLKSHITFIKEVDENESVSYSRTYKTTKKTKKATIPIGYADGIRRSLSNKGEVVINGKKAPIIGNVCMDSFMIDISNIDNVEVGNEVYIWDNEIITLDDVANTCNTINYEILCCISDRVPRVFK